VLNSHCPPVYNNAKKETTHVSFQERGNNVTSIIPLIDEVYEPLGSSATINNSIAKYSPLNVVEDCGAAHCGFFFLRGTKPRVMKLEV
jgi:hypothetical protein